MHIAIFDYMVKATNPVGSCHLHVIGELSREHDVTVFATEFESSGRASAKFLRIPAPKRPLFLLFVSFHVLAPAYYWLHTWWHKIAFDAVQSVESNTLLGTVVYSQFCHRAYLRDHWRHTQPMGLRRWARWLDHKLHAVMEPLVYRRAAIIVVPCQGLAREMVEVYGEAVRSKIRVIPNPVDVRRMRPPQTFDRRNFRASLGFAAEDLVLAFVALGHFERKGLPLLLAAIRAVAGERTKLLVVGGLPLLVQQYRQRIAIMGISEQVRFVGMQRDIRPYLWSADMFAFPSAYEAFSLASLEAAAAGLPLLVPPLHGVEEFLLDGKNGWCVPRTSEAFADKIAFGLEHRDVLQEMGRNAAESAEQYNIERFMDRWRALYMELAISCAR
jgi:glycosyltransferase involved in cell wall biosynthesis